RFLQEEREATSCALPFCAKLWLAGVMVRKRSESGWRAASLAAALFAITLNFLQPLAHAALMRDGGATTSSWAAMCLPSALQGAAKDNAQGQAPAPGKMHECCLGRAHPPAIAEPAFASILFD